MLEVLKTAQCGGVESGGELGTVTIDTYFDDFLWCWQHCLVVTKCCSSNITVLLYYMRCTGGYTVYRVLLIYNILPSMWRKVTIGGQV